MRQKHKIVAKCLDSKGRVISVATNSYKKTHPIQAHFAKMVGHPERIYLHAEIRAILRAGDKQIHTIEVSRINSQGNLALAKPCPVCMAAIKAYGIKFVKWSIT
ncbi:MAG: hypothetical protein HC831_26735 [Chloroflexia bacterium]|nr:hypothetical protein [Chloroflexia bacterium]